ncbi:tRNA 5-methoxyuridine(34)/uridine 5-oxyacetic acid(34) synthase CmoB [Glaciecola sp. SC05]|uniref:tRNA 5-methoxyuridine(34)/uridine 5-oxyacetic acid(34) synthase CmoB n=1 Tax=Glaciecola sp. SC05 TaxID=1987355 RepID=UPI003527EF9F
MNNGWKGAFYQSVINTPLQSSLITLMPLLEAWEGEQQHASAKKWAKQLNNLPRPKDVQLNISDTVILQSLPPLDLGEQKRINSILKQFMPWRKGPFKLFGVEIDTEWRSDFKWSRVSPHLTSLTGKRVLDVGCGSGYHLFRMLEDGASQVIGIDPTPLFFYQFQIFKQYLPEHNLHYLPIGIEDLPTTQAFDTVFSMGVFYHRPDPLLFLKQLKNQLSTGGQLVLETLVINGDENTVLLPSDRYAQMSNVYFLPSIAAMKKWLEKVGFKDVSLVDDCVTSLDEQRSTEWMDSLSLKDFLDPDDLNKTIEGYEAPRRATFIATR